MAFEQLGHRVQQEGEEQAMRLGEIEPPLEGAPGGLPFPERFPSARLQQESRDQPHLMRTAGRAVEDGRERVGRRPRVVLGEPQRCHSRAHTWPFALILGRLGQGSIGLCGLSQPHEGVQEERAQLRREWVRCAERPPRQASGGAECG
jgi:hypothetical protein